MHFVMKWSLAITAIVLAALALWWSSSAGDSPAELTIQGGRGNIIRNAVAVGQVEPEYGELRNFRPAPGS